MTSVANGDNDFSKALAENPMYVRLRKCVGSAKNLLEHLEAHEDERPSENPVTDLPLATDTLNTKTMDSNHESHTCDIIEEEDAGSANVFEEKALKNLLSTSSKFVEQHESVEGTFISAEVEWALGVLNRAIAHFQGSVTPSEESIYLEKTAQATTSTSDQNREVCDDGDDIINKQETESISRPSDATEGGFSFPVFR